MRNRITTAADGSAVYRAIDGDMVDFIAFTFFGRHGKYTEEIYAMNPGLAAHGPVLSAGTLVKLPRAKTQNEPRKIRQLWE